MNPATIATPQNRALLIVYSSYRLLLSLVLLVMFFFAMAGPLLGSHDPGLFLRATTVYAGFAAGMLFLHLVFNKSTTPGIIFTGFCGDIAALMVIAHSSGSMSSGLQLLLIVTIAAANMLLGMRLGILVAALTSLAVIADTTILVLYHDATSELYLPTGLLGMAFFLTAMVIQYLTQRIVQEQQQAERGREDVRQLLEINQSIVQNMRTGVLVMRPDGRIRLINQAAAELLGIDFHDSPFAEYAPHQLIELSTGRNIHSTRLRLDNGPELQVSVTSFGPGDREERLLFIEDMGKIAQHAQQLKLASLGRLTASIAHEVRNPLGAISHASQLLGESRQVDEQEARLIEIINSHSRRMNQVIENVLELSRRKRSDPQLLDLGSWLREYVDNFMAGRYDRPTLSVDIIGERHPVKVDPSQLEQVLDNIVTNGLRFSEQATGVPRVSLVVKRLPGTPGATLDILDEGPGVPDSDREKIFEPFYTGDKAGNGLGLYICRELCESNQIDLIYRPNGNKSCFRLQFPHPQRGSIPG